MSGPGAHMPGAVRGQAAEPDRGRFLREVVRHALLCSPGTEDFRARMAQSALACLPAGRLAIYGCGRASALLAQAAAEELRRRDTRFLTSAPDGEDAFYGFPKLRPEDVIPDPPDHALVLSKSWERTMLERLAFLPRERVYTLDELLARVDERPLHAGILDRAAESAAAAVEQARGFCAQGRTLCFTAYGLSQHFLKIARRMRREGWNVVLVAGRDSVNEGMTLDAFRQGGWFDMAYVSRFAYGLELIEFLRACPFAAVHMVATMADTPPQAAAVREARCPVVVEYCDFKQIVFDDEDYARLTLGQDPAQYRLECDAQQALYTEAAGIVYKDDPAVVAHLDARYGVSSRTLHFLPYIDAGESELPPVKPVPPAGAEYSVVYAGCLHNNPKWHPYLHHVRTLEAIRRITGQGLRFAVYNAMDATGKGYEDYLELAEKNPLFEYHFALPYAELSGILSRYDFGMHCFDVTRINESRFFLRTTLASKVFTYIEAGLPVLMMTETEYMWGLVQELGVGAAVDFADLHRLREIIESHDWERTGRNLARTRQELSLERHAPRLAEFYLNARTGKDAPGGADSLRG